MKAFIDFVEDFSERTYSVLDLVTTQEFSCLPLVHEVFAIPGLRLGFVRTSSWVNSGNSCSARALDSELHCPKCR